MRDRLFPIAAALAALLTTSAAVGQQPEDADDQRSEDGVEEMVVTGTRLRDLIAGVPVVTITKQEMLQRGIGTVEDVMRALPQNFSAINAAATLDNSMNSVDAIGQSAVNLRGLGSSGTLVLVNGRRWVQSSTFANGTVNLNGIPFGAIERVEVLTDGASAVYGADAQAGVVNFILREDFVGGETALRQDIGGNGGDVMRIDQTVGLAWDGGRLMASLGYQKNGATDRRKAGLATLDFRPRGGSDQRSRFFGQPGIVGYGFPGSFFQAIRLGALAPGDDGTQGVAGRLSLANVVPLDEAALGGHLNGGTAVSDSLTAYVSASHDLWDGKLTLFGDLTWAENSSRTTGAPIAGTYTVPATNPYNDLPPLPPFVVTVGYSFVAETAAGLIPPRSNEGGQENLTLTAGATMDLPFGDWQAEVSVRHADEDAYFGFVTADGDLLAERIAGVDAAGNPLPMERIINPFGDGSAQSPAALEGLVSVLTDAGPASANTNTATQLDYAASAKGGLFELPGGTSQLALGVELRTETLDYASDQSRGTLFIVLEPERVATSAFAEWSLPIVSERNGRPGLRALGVKLAARYDDYVFEGPFDGDAAPWREEAFDHASLKADIAWRPVRSLNLRASWGESFVPPTSSRLFSATNGPFNFLPIIDPENPSAGLQFPDLYFVGNPELTPEISENLNLGLDWSPGGFLEGLEVSATWARIDISDRIGSVGFSDPSLFFVLPGLVQRNADGSIARIDLKALNLVSRESESVDAKASYAFATRFGDVQVGVEGTYTDGLSEVPAPGAPPRYLHGTASGPERLKGFGFLALSRDDVTLRLQANYSGSYENNTSRAQDKVASYVTVDLTGTWRFGDSGWSASGGARNLLDAEFPFFDGFGAPWDPRRVDLRGRIIHLELRSAYGLGR